MSQQTQKSEKANNLSTGQSSFEVPKGTVVSQDINIETITQELEQTIKKYEITSNMDKEDVKDILEEKALKKELQKAISQGIIKKEKNLYSYGAYKNLTEDQILEAIYNANKEIINRNIEKEYENIQLFFQKNNKITRISEIRQEKDELANVSKQLLEQREKLVDNLEKKNNEYLQTMYKQSKLESQMRTEIFNQQSQQQNVGFQYSKLNQGLQSQALQNKGLISQGESQIQTATQNQMQNKQNIAVLQQQYEATKLKHKDAEQQRVLLKQANIIASETLNQTRNLRSDLANNFRDMSNLMSDLSREQIQTIKQTSEAQLRATQQTKEAVEQASAQNVEGQVEIIKAINGNAAQISMLNQNVNNLNNSMNDLTAQVGNLSKDLNKLGNATPPIPPACTANAVCGGSWILRTNTATSKTRQGDGNVTIWQCDKTGHFCASNGETDGNRPGASSWNKVYYYFDGVPISI